MLSKTKGVVVVNDQRWLPRLMLPTHRV